MEKTKDYEIMVDGIKRVFRFHPVSFTNISEMRNAINSVSDPNGNTVDRLCNAVIGTIEMINGETQQSLGMCKKVELEALLNPFAMYELICNAVEFQESFCGAYPNSLVLISAVKSFVCAGGTE